MIENIKWLGTVICIIGAFINAAGIFPFGVIVLLAGGLIWLVASIMMKDKALITTNIAMSIATVAGLVVKFL